MKYIFFTLFAFIFTINCSQGQNLEKPSKISIDLQSIGWGIAIQEIMMYRVNFEQMLTEKNAINFSHGFERFTYSSGSEGTVELLTMWKRYIGKKGFYLGPYVDISYMYRPERGNPINTMYLGAGFMLGHVINIKDFFFEIEAGLGFGDPLNQDFYYSSCDGCWVWVNELNNSIIKFSPSFFNVNFGYRF